MKVFFDVESNSTPGTITLDCVGLSTEDGNHFYGEVMNLGQALRERKEEREGEFPPRPNGASGSLLDLDATMAFGEASTVADALLDWLADLGPVELWTDRPEPDWGLLRAFLGGADRLPPGVHSEPFDLRALLQSRGLAAPLESILAGQEAVHSLTSTALHRAIRLRESYAMLTKKDTPG